MPPHKLSDADLARWVPLNGVPHLADGTPDAPTESAISDAVLRMCRAIRLGSDWKQWFMKAVQAAPSGARKMYVANRTLAVVNSVIAEELGNV